MLATGKGYLQVYLELWVQNVVVNPAECIAYNVYDL